MSGTPRGTSIQKTTMNSNGKGHGVVSGLKAVTWNNVNMFAGFRGLSAKVTAYLRMRSHYLPLLNWCFTLIIGFATMNDSLALKGLFDKVLDVLFTPVRTSVGPLENANTLTIEHNLGQRVEIIPKRTELLSVLVELTSRARDIS